MDCREPSIEEVAYHEAGHAVAHFVNRVRFVEIRIVLANEELGRVVVAAPPKWYRPDIDSSESSPNYLRSRFFMERLVIGSMAGHIAQHRYAQRPPELETYRYDLEASFADVCRWVGSDHAAEAYLKFLWEMARDLVDMDVYWAAIKAVAAALLERKTIKYRDASKLIREAMVR